MLRSVEAERVRRQLTKEEMAKELGVSLKTYYNWISEETDMPISFLIKMSNMFGTTTDYLLEGASGARQKNGR
ncbi:MAG: helix-turn-helix transcriptional regulator [Lachnospiraceae bacterium]|jgi:DNA-binding XRE family transcriptional regulator|nr:helix-turn-helix transcriptional regulator [Lachnospiraceae bacterium]MCI9470763.1 helix-turn-helix transcriptional regulator [Lachnospiraceae bacterium]